MNRVTCWQVRERTLRVLPRPFAAPIRREVYVPKRSAPGFGEPLRVLGIPHAQFVGSWFRQRRDIVREKFHFLREPALDDRVALIEAEGECFAVQDLLVHAVFD